jgi:hypothetical protein
VPRPHLRKISSRASTLTWVRESECVSAMVRFLFLSLSYDLPMYWYRDEIPFAPVTVDGTPGHSVDPHIMTLMSASLGSYDPTLPRVLWRIARLGRVVAPKRVTTPSTCTEALS